MKNVNLNWESTYTTHIYDLVIKASILLVVLVLNVLVIRE